jgi:hypothetical protein
MHSLSEVNMERECIKIETLKGNFLQPLYNLEKNIWFGLPNL